jgi:hypothetical protein
MDELFEISSLLMKKASERRKNLMFFGEELGNLSSGSASEYKSKYFANRKFILFNFDL